MGVILVIEGIFRIRIQQIFYSRCILLTIIHRDVGNGSLRLNHDIGVYNYFKRSVDDFRFSPLFQHPMCAYRRAFDR